MAVTTISGLTQDAASTNVSAKTLSSDFSDFLTLLTTQLQNQDPLSPMDSNEFTNQLVQFSQVEQQINSNQKLDSLLALQTSSTFNSAFAYVGMDIKYISSDLAFDGTTPTKVTYSLGSEVETGYLRINDEDGNLVRKIDLAGKSGKNDYVWDGKDDEGNVMKAGTYTMQVDALDADNEAVSTTLVVQGNVRGVETQDGTVYLLVGDRAVPMSYVLNASLPDTEPVDTTTTTTDDNA